MTDPGIDYYFTDRQYNHLGIAGSAHGPIWLDSDVDDQSPEAASRTLEGTVWFGKKERAQVTQMIQRGNFVMYLDEDDNKVWMTITTEVPDFLTGSWHFTAEDAGMDLINETVGAYKADKAYSIAEYMQRFTDDSGFEIGINEIPNLTRTLSWDSTDETALKRIQSVATQFDGAEIDFSFDIKGTQVTHKYINIYKQKGADRGVWLDVGKQINNLQPTSDVTSVMTAIQGTGATPDPPEGDDGTTQQQPITLKGYDWTDPDGRYVINEDGVLLDTAAVNKWSRLRTNADPNPGNSYIVRTKTYEAKTQATLLQSELADLKKYAEPAINWTADIYSLPMNVKAGDTIHLRDEEAGYAVSTRVLELKTCHATGIRTGTFGDYSIAERDAAAIQSNMAQNVAKIVDGKIVPVDNRLEAVKELLNKQLEELKEQAAELQKALDANRAYVDEQVEQLTIAVNAAQQAAIDTSKRDLTDELGTLEQKWTETYDGITKTISDYQAGWDSKISDLDGRVSDVTQTVGGFQAKVDDAVAGVQSKFDVFSKSINGIVSTDNLKVLFAAQIDDQVASLVGRLEDAEGNLATLTALVNGIQTSVSGADGLKSQISQLKELINLRVTSADVTTQITAALKGIDLSQIDDLNKQLISLSGQIGDITGWQQTVEDGLKDVKSQITQTANTWLLNLNDQKTALEADIAASVKAGTAKLQLSVGSDGKIALINNGVKLGTDIEIIGSMVHITGDTDVKGDVLISKLADATGALKLSNNSMQIVQNEPTMSSITINPSDGLLFLKGTIGVAGMHAGWTNGTTGALTLDSYLQPKGDAFRWGYIVSDTEAHIMMSLYWSEAKANLAGQPAGLSLATNLILRGDIYSRSATTSANGHVHFSEWVSADGKVGGIQLVMDLGAGIIWTNQAHVLVTNGTDSKQLI